MSNQQRLTIRKKQELFLNFLSLVKVFLRMCRVRYNAEIKVDYSSTAAREE
mgnify:FL=1